MRDNALLLRGTMEMILNEVLCFVIRSGEKFDVLAKIAGSVTT